MFFFVSQPLHASDFILVDFVVELFHKCGWQVIYSDEGVAPYVSFDS